MSKYTVDLLPERNYHIYNRSNNKEPLFKSDANRLYFLTKYKSYISPFCKTFAYCLLKNHFHILIQIKSELAIFQVLENMPKDELSNFQKEFLKGFEKDGNEDSKHVISLRNDMFHNLIANQFRRFFIAYSKAFNKQHNREGNLFNRPFKRLDVENEAHFTQLVFYIHNNPTHHKLVSNFRNYKWSSYKSLVSDKPTTLQRSEVLDWFGGVEAFVEFHNLYDFKNESYKIEKLIIEDQYV